MRQRQKKTFDSRHKAQSLHPLSPGESVWLPDQGTDGKVIEESGPRSYTVQTPDGQYRRNRRHIISLPIESDPRQNPPTTSSDVLPDVPIQPSSTNKSVSKQPITNGIRLKSGRISKPPDRLTLT